MWIAESAAWYVVRVSGLTAWFMAGASLGLGVLASSRLMAWRPATLVGLHRWSSTSAAILVVVHVVALFFEDYAAFSAAEILVPLEVGWRSLGMAAGIVSAYLVGVIVVSSVAMRRLPRRLWRAIHLSSHPVFWLSTYHGLSVGTDVEHAAVTFGGAAVVWSVLVLVGARLALRQSNGGRPAPRTSISETPLTVGPGIRSAPARNSPGTSRSTGMDLPSSAPPWETLIVPPHE